MKIAQVAPLYESVPPQLYGGTERVVAYLTDALVRQGHDVTLFASGDSRSRARLQPVSSRALRLSDCRDALAHHMLLLDRVAREADRFDLVHFHIDYLHFPLTRLLKIPNVTTLHGRLDLPDLVPVYQEFNDMPVVSISDHQRTPLPFANWQATVYHGLPEDLYRIYPESGKYLAFLGRISPEKRVDRAILIAQRVGMELRIAAKVDKADEAYFKARIQPLFSHPLVNFIGEIGEKDKNEFLGNAHALLFPIDWPEPFGLVMIEAMACGTPVIAYRRGSVSEIVRDGETGFVVDDLNQAVAAVARLDTVSRRRCRETFEERFCASRMARDYLAAYLAIIDTGLRKRSAA
ncbi:MAG: glycosyltransferase family 4 protein [Gammaproteobacteria bacterium]